ncbi:MAG: S41 family peptidase [Eubacterium sp.]|nr:S41 family peptidase [Eubacterium sp.]
MNKRNKKVVKRIYFMGMSTGFVGCLLVLLILQVFGVIPKFWSSELVEDIKNRASVVEKCIDKYYWKDDVSHEKISAYAAKGMVSALGDKYSAYYTSEEMEETMEEVKGDYAGIGASIILDRTTNKKYITSVQEGKPAEKAGLKDGDEIRKVNGEDVSDKSLTDTSAMIKGEEGKTSVLTILREENKKKVTKEIKVTCERIVNQSVDSKMLDGKIGYIQIKNFDEETSSQFKECVEKLEKQNQKGMIVDVRNNGGGTLSAAVNVLNRLLPAGKLITETSKGKEDKIYESTDEEQFDKPLVVLINESSASASEVFAGSLQDRGAATLVGVKSFGKGIIQTIFSLEKSCGGGIKLTTGEYLLPSGRSIHEKGLTPDVESEYTGTSKDLGAEDDNQLKKAMEVMETKLEQ